MKNQEMFTQNELKILLQIIDSVNIPGSVIEVIYNLKNKIRGYLKKEAEPKVEGEARKK